MYWMFWRKKAELRMWKVNFGIEFKLWLFLISYHKTKTYLPSSKSNWVEKSIEKARMEVCGVCDV
jgi:hypothetical protein